MAALPIDLDRVGRTPLAAQIYRTIRQAIETGQLASGARLPSWRDLAAQLGVSRGTVRVAYERLVNEQFAIGLGAAGTRVAERPMPSSSPGWSPDAPPLPDLFSPTCALWLDPSARMNRPPDMPATVEAAIAIVGAVRTKMLLVLVPSRMRDVRIV